MLEELGCKNNFCQDKGSLSENFCIISCDMRRLKAIEVNADEMLPCNINGLRHFIMLT